MSDEKNKTRLALTGAIVAAVTASLCCILPLAAAVLGFTGFAASQFFEHWRPYLLAVTFGLLAVGFYFAYRRPREACEAGTVCARTQIDRWNRAALWLVAVLVALVAAFPYYSGRVARAVAQENRPALATSSDSTEQVVLRVEGMDCGACAALIEKNLARVPGVVHARVDFASQQAQVEYDPHKVDPSRFSQVITEAGFKVATPNPNRGTLAFPPPPQGAPPHLTDLSADLEPLRVDFNRDAMSPRLLLLLSPT